MCYLLDAINLVYLQLEEVKRKLYQSELKKDTLTSAIDEIKAQHDLERDKLVFQSFCYTSLASTRGVIS